MPRKIRHVKRRTVRRRKIDSHEKGHLFEDVVEKYFQLLGYSIERNVKVKGFSGATHEIDVLVEKNGVKGIVEVKNYSKPVPKEWVMKASNVAKDISAQEVYVVSASGFTEDARKVAEVLGVTLLDLEDMAKEVRRLRSITSLSLYHTRPVADSDTIRKIAERHIVKRLFRPVEEVKDVELFYHPFYAIDAEYIYTEKIGIFFTRDVEKRAVTSFYVDAVRGTILVLGRESEYSRNYFVKWSSLPLVSKEEAVLLRILYKNSTPMTISELGEKTGWSRQRINKLISNLAAGGLVKCSPKENEKNSKITIFCSATLALPHIQSIRDTNNILSPILVSERPRNGVIADSRNQVPESLITSAIETFYDVNVVGRKLVYLPVYRVKFVSTEDDSYRYMYFLACTDPPIELDSYEEK